TGVYAVRAGIDLGPETLWRDGVTNFGSRPTFGGGEKVLEVHLFGDCDDLRGRHLRVALAAYLRPEKTFDGAAQLQAQIADDIAAAKTALAELPGGGEAAEIPPSLAGAADGTT
ncbi:MAG: riboflavin kinase, partial [Alphaproteobacteria bacterium]|nr:riboflavin kinase [Alphaproteobacteria bacterium]